MNGKTGLILEGGALRGVFTAGVLDYLLAKMGEFPYVIGVSAGSGNASSFTSKQPGRMKKVLMHENRESFFGFNQLMKNKKILNLDMVVVEFAQKDFPFDFDTFFASDTECVSVVVNCETGEAEYHSDYKDKDELLKYNVASMSLPFICDPVEINGKYYLDGSLVDSLPCRHAIDAGCEKLVAVMTKPLGAKVTDYSKIRRLVEHTYGKKYPKLAASILKRKDNYDEQMRFLNKLEAEGRAFIIRPEEATISHFENSPEKLNACYNYGYDIMKQQYNDLLEFMNK